MHETDLVMSANEDEVCFSELGLDIVDRTERNKYYFL